MVKNQQHTPNDVTPLGGIRIGNTMIKNDNAAHARFTKLTWLIYKVLAVLLAAALVLLLANDNEERLFYGLMTIACAYVFRPTDKFMDDLIKKYKGVVKEPEPEATDDIKEDSTDKNQ